MVLRPKPRNCHGDFEAQISKPLTLVFMPKQKNVTVVLRPNHWQTISNGFEAKPENPRFSSPPRVRCGSQMPSPDLPIVRLPSTRLVPDHSQSSAPSLLHMPRSSSLPAMSHSPPTHHETRKHVSPNRISQFGVSSIEICEFKFNLEQFNYSSHI
jgi:hypothetical protein